MRPDTGKKWHVRRLATSSWICFGIRCRIIRVTRTFPLWIRTISLYLICLARKAGAGVIMKEKTWGIGTERVKIKIGGWSPEDGTPEDGTPEDGALSNEVTKTRI